MPTKRSTARTTALGSVDSAESTGLVVPAAAQGPDDQRPDRGSGGVGQINHTIATVERAADVLVYFAESPAQTLGVTEIAEAQGLSKAAVHRILASFRATGLIELDEATRRYSLGVTAMRLGQAYLNRLDIRRAAHPALVTLSERTGETATLSIRSHWTRFYVDQVTPQREVIMSVTLGASYPLHAGASSKAFLAFLDPAEAQEYLAQPALARLTSATSTDPAALRREIDRIRAQGYARSAAERQSGAASVAAPVMDHTGQVVAVISVCGPVERFSVDEQTRIDALLDTTARLSARMGFDAHERG